MDMDTTQSKFAHENMLGQFRAGEADILLGTQMVTKGHDFPNVTAVGVILADSSLYVDDFRAAEHTFSMLTQVIGRAGRGNDPGVAVIQTYNPESETITLAARQDYAAFYSKEIKLREALVFPPFCDIAVVTLVGNDEAALGLASSKMAAAIKKRLEGEYRDLYMIVFGPFEAPVYKVQNQFRMRSVIKCRLGRRCRQFFSEILNEFGSGGEKQVKMSVDFNPSSI